jgi:hypothetical protein
MIQLIQCIYCKEYFTCSYECGKYGMTSINNNNIGNCACNNCTSIEKAIKENVCKVKPLTEKELIAYLI